ncbi:hypothetical protein SAMN05421827_111179 [Pedobacter terrae]|uniref:Uncharacterized protein n=1 Tax=Pedobacter terrae TaxID=405671 RepID=A0A1G7XEH1_9SPHI|nr:hypothetical protein [Pedobacter terrae]SDG82517.1 hypothetical protein SAMN05421827_111179 [Pedobacter terrae]
MTRDYKIHYLVMLEIQRLVGTNVDFHSSWRKMSDQEVTAFIDNAIISYPGQKIEDSTDKLTPGFYTHLFVELPANKKSQ